MYSQMSVTIRPNAPIHSIYFGAPISAPFSMKSKSRTKFSAAMITTNTLNPMSPFCLASRRVLGQHPRPWLMCLISLRR